MCQIVMWLLAIVQDFPDAAAAVVFITGCTVQSAAALTWH